MVRHVTNVGNEIDFSSWGLSIGQCLGVVASGAGVVVGIVL